MAKDGEYAVHLLPADVSSHCSTQQQLRVYEYAWLGEESQKRRRLRASRNHNLVSLAAAEEACAADQSCGGVSDLYCNGTARLPPSTTMPEAA